MSRKIAATSWKIRIVVAVSPTGRFCWCRSAIRRATTAVEGEGEGGADEERGERRQAEQQPEAAEARRSRQHLDRPEAEDVARLLAHVGQRSAA